VSSSDGGRSCNTVEVAGPSTSSTADPPMLSVTPALALVFFESSLSTEQVECFNFCFGKGYDLAKDELFMNWKQLKLLAVADSPTVADVTRMSDFLPDVSSVPVPPDAQLSVTSDNVLPQLDVSLTDLLTHNLDHIEQSSSDQNTTIEANMPPEPQTCSNKNLVLDTEPLSTGVDWKKFPFSNSSDPEDSGADILPYPAPVSQKPKNRTKKKYFVLTSREAREATLQEIQDKLNREVNKKARIRKKQEKLESTVAKQNCRESVKRQNKKSSQPFQVKSKQSQIKQKTKQQKENQSDTMPCSVCSTRFCDDFSGRQWIQCQ